MNVNTPVYVAGFERGVRPIGDWSMSTTLSTRCAPSTLSCAQERPGAHESDEGAIQDVVDERRLARARHARHAGERAERDLHRHALQVVLARVVDREGVAAALPPR